MKVFLLLVLLLCVGMGQKYSNMYGGFVQNKNSKSVIKTKLPELKPEEIPGQFWWGNVNGVNYLTVQRNQHIPIYCGACWAFSATSCMSDRIKIRRMA
jgi:cathepsin X